MFQHLTEREHEVARLAIQGLTNQEIAAKLGLAEQTIKNTLRNIFIKARLRNRVHLLLTYPNGSGRKRVLLPARPALRRLPVRKYMPN